MKENSSSSLINPSGLRERLLSLRGMYSICPLQQTRAVAISPAIAISPVTLFNIVIKHITVVNLIPESIPNVAQTPKPRSQDLNRLRASHFGLSFNLVNWPVLLEILCLKFCPIVVNEN